MEVPWPIALQVWWAFIWRYSLYGFLAGVVLGAIGGYIAQAIGHLDKARIVGLIAGYIAALIGSIPAMKQALQTHLQGLRSNFQNGRSNTWSGP